MSVRLRLATRGSDLALVQTREVAAGLRASWPDLAVEEEIIRTQGDNNLEADLATIGALDKGLFTKELEQALRQGAADAAVHSLKDLPVVLPPGLVLGAVLPRAATEDVLVAHQPGGWEALPAGARVGTSSPRRQAMLRARRGDVQPVMIRGNVPTRLGKLADGGFEAIIVAAAGLHRLGWVTDGPIEAGGVVLHAVPLRDFLPAPGQGAIAVEIRADDEVARDLLAPLHDAMTDRCVRAERAVLGALGGGCHMALGTRAWMEGGLLHLEAVVFDDPGATPKHAAASGDPDDPESVGRAAAEKLHGD
ncbi:MAG: hydroxymethylbilane synthase [Chthoniobacterales bacterium]